MGPPDAPEAPRDQGASDQVPNEGLSEQHSGRDRALAMLRLLVPEGTVVELRAPDAGRERVVSGYFDDLEALAKAAGALHGKAPGTYFTMNPVVPALLARCKNKTRPYTKQTTADHDIARRRWVLIDLDPVRPSGICSTDAEHDAALAKAGKVVEYLEGLGFPAPVTADSGNGAYVLVPVDLPNDDAARELVRRFLEALAARFNDGATKIDTSVHNAARIIRVPGTVNAKGDNVPERPHRRVRLLRTPEPEPASAELLEAATATEAKAEPDQEKAERPKADVFEDPGSGSFDLETWIADHGLEVRNDGPWSGTGHRWVLKVCPFNEEHNRGEAWIARTPRGAKVAGCQHESCRWKWADLRAKLEPEATKEAKTEEIHPRTQAILDAALDATDLDSLPEPEPLIVGLLNVAESTILAGKFGTYKSFLALAWSYALATGQSWSGHEVPEPKPVVYVAAEGVSGLRRRLHALERRYGVKVPAGMLTIIRRPVHLANAEEVEGLRRLVAERSAALVVLDTWHRMTPGIEENSATETGGPMDVALSIRDDYGATVLVVDHTGHLQQHARGSSAKEDDADAAWLIRLGASDDAEDRSPATPRTLEHRKSKDGELAAPVVLRLETDDQGEATVAADLFTTPAVRPARTGRPPRALDHESAVLELIEALDEDGVPVETGEVNVKAWDESRRPGRSATREVVRAAIRARRHRAATPKVAASLEADGGDPTAEVTPKNPPESFGVGSDLGEQTAEGFSPKGPPGVSAGGVAESPPGVSAGSEAAS